MTDIYTVSIDAVEGTSLRGRVHIIHPDAPFVPEDPSFPLALMMDAWWLLEEGYLHDGIARTDGGDLYPLTEEEAGKLAAGLRVRDEFRELYDLALGKKIRVDRKGYMLGEDGKTVLEPRRLAKDVYDLDPSSGSDKISRYVLTETRPEEFRERAARVITSYTHGPERNVPLWREVAAVRDVDLTEEDHEELDTFEEADLGHLEADLEDWRTWLVLRERPFEGRPYAEISVTVSDPAYLEHLRPGMRWSTTHMGY